MRLALAGRTPRRRTILALTLVLAGFGALTAASLGAFPWQQSCAQACTPPETDGTVQVHKYVPKTNPGGENVPWQNEAANSYTFQIYNNAALTGTPLATFNQLGSPATGLPQNVSLWITEVVPAGQAFAGFFVPDGDGDSGNDKCNQKAADGSQFTTTQNKLEVTPAMWTAKGNQTGLLHICAYNKPAAPLPGSVEVRKVVTNVADDPTLFDANIDGGAPFTFSELSYSGNHPAAAGPHTVTELAEPGYVTQGWAIGTAGANPVCPAIWTSTAGDNTAEISVNAGATTIVCVYNEKQVTENVTVYKVAKAGGQPLGVTDSFTGKLTRILTGEQYNWGPNTGAHPDGPGAISVPPGEYAVSETPATGWTVDGYKRAQSVAECSTDPASYSVAALTINATYSVICVMNYKAVVPVEQQVTFVKAICPSYGVVPANNSPATSDETGGHAAELDTSYGKSLVNLAADIPASCTPAAGWVFNFWSGSDSGTGTGTGPLGSTAATGADGKAVQTLTPAQLAAATSGNGLWISEATQAGVAGFGALRCYQDIQGGDNLEAISLVAAGTSGVSCIAYNVPPAREITIAKIRTQIGTSPAPADTFAGSISDNSGAGFSIATTAGGTAAHQNYLVSRGEHTVTEVLTAAQTTAGWSLAGYKLAPGLESACGTDGYTAGDNVIPQDANSYTLCIKNVYSATTVIVKKDYVLHGVTRSTPTVSIGGASATLNTAAGTATHDEWNAMNVSPGVLSVVEAVPPGWANTDVAFVDCGSTSGSNGAVNVTVSSGQTCIVTFTNSRDIGAITVYKQKTAESPADSATVFSGNIDGDSAHFGWAVRGIGGAPSEVANVPTGAHTVVELLSGGWVRAGAGVALRNPATGCPADPSAYTLASVDVTKGQTTHVCVLNRLQTGSVVITKVVQPGGSVNASDSTPAFDGTFDGSPWAAGGLTDGQSVTLSNIIAGNNHTITENAGTIGRPFDTLWRNDGFFVPTPSGTCATSPVGQTLLDPHHIAVTGGQTTTICVLNARNQPQTVTGTVSVYKDVVSSAPNSTDVFHGVVTTTAAGGGGGTFDLANGAGRQFSIHLDSDAPNARFSVREDSKAGYQTLGYRLLVGSAQGCPEPDGNYAAAPTDIAIGAASELAYTVCIYNQPRVNIIVNKVEVSDGVRSVGQGWKITLSGCGITPETKPTSGVNGTAEWIGIAPCANYIVSEDPDSKASLGFVPFGPAAVVVNATGAAQTYIVTFTNERRTPLPPLGTATPVPQGPTPVPSTPTASAKAPTATPSATPNAAVAGEKTPALTPVPPSSGSGGGAGSSPSAALLILGGLLLAAATLTTLALATRTRKS